MSCVRDELCEMRCEEEEEEEEATEEEKEKEEEKAAGCRAEKQNPT